MISKRWKTGAMARMSLPKLLALAHHLAYLSSLTARESKRRVLTAMPPGVVYPRRGMRNPSLQQHRIPLTTPLAFDVGEMTTIKAKDCEKEVPQRVIRHTFMSQGFLRDFNGSDANMQISLFVLALVLLLSKGVLAEGENEVKRGQFPFMAFVYYPDDSVVDETGNRFRQAAVLIQPNWLVTSDLNDIALIDGFPQKTLLARTGAVRIDTNFTLNEDEEEQEREIIEIVYPTRHNLTQSWYTDITLMKTLLPFNMSSAVMHATLQPKHDFTEKTCGILVYVKKYDNSWTDDNVLMQFSVELIQPSTVETCGDKFHEDTMICAFDSDSNRISNYPQFCHGNRGGPLICEGTVMGTQIYADKNCKHPYLYQQLSQWDNFLSCGTAEKCSEEQCSKICKSINKDVPIIVTGAESATDVTSIITISTLPTTNEGQPARRSETGNAGEVGTVTSTSSETSEFSVEVSKKVPTQKTSLIEKYNNEHHKLANADDCDDDERQTKVEAQQVVEKKKMRSGAVAHVFSFKNIIFAVLVLAGFI